MSMKNLFKVATLGLLLCSCQGKEVGSMATVNINPQEQSDDFVPLIKEVEFIPLDSSQKALVGSVGAVILQDDLVYISQYDNNECIKVFDIQSGGYVKSVGSVGRGAGEAMSHEVFTVDDNNILVSGWYPNKKVNYYNNENAFIKDKGIAYPFGDIITLNPETFLLYVSNGTFSDEAKFSLLLTDKDFNVKKRLFEKVEWRDKYGMGETTRFFKNGEDVYFRDEYNDTIYDIRNDVVEPKYKLNFGKYWVSDDFLKEYSDKNIFEFYGEYKKSFAQFIKFAVSDKYVIVSYCLAKETSEQGYDIFSAIYDKDSGLTMNSSSRKSPLTYLFRNIFYMDDNEAVGIIDAARFMEIKDVIDVPKPIKDAVNRVSKDISDNSNSILVKIKLK